MINVKGVKRFCCEDISTIENYELAVADTKRVWCCHHRLEYNESTGKFTLSFVLKKRGLYYHRPASELIFMTLSDHRALHFKDPRIAEKMKGEKHPRHGRHPFFCSAGGCARTGRSIKTRSHS